jgi:hypothetical protein
MCPLAPKQPLGVHGACATRPDGGLAVQVQTPPAREVRQDG